jgi:hypothetical protein
MRKNDRIRIGERFFNFKIGHTFIGVVESEKDADGVTRKDRVSFVVPYDDALLDRERLRELIMLKIENK